MLKHQVHCGQCPLLDWWSGLCKKAGCTSHEEHVSSTPPWPLRHSCFQVPALSSYHNFPGPHNKIHPQLPPQAALVVMFSTAVETLRQHANMLQPCLPSAELSRSLQHSLPGAVLASLLLSQPGHHLCSITYLCIFQNTRLRPCSSCLSAVLVFPLAGLYMCSLCVSAPPPMYQDETSRYVGMR